MNNLYYYDETYYDSDLYYYNDTYYYDDTYYYSDAYYYEDTYYSNDPYFYDDADYYGDTGYYRDAVYDSGIYYYDGTGAVPPFVVIGPTIDPIGILAAYVDPYSVAVVVEPFYQGVAVLHVEAAGFVAFNATRNERVVSDAHAYTGPVRGLQSEFITVTPDSLNIAVNTDNWFIHTGSGDDAIAVFGGINVIDGGQGSNFLVGGTGTDTFFIDNRGTVENIWSTVVGFHAGDAATFWGVTPQDFAIQWVDGQGAAGYTGLTVHASAVGRPTASLTLAGYTDADRNSGRLSVLFGTDTASGSSYMYVHGNS